MLWVPDLESYLSQMPKFLNQDLLVMAKSMEVIMPIPKQNAKSSTFALLMVKAAFLHILSFAPTEPFSTKIISFVIGGSTLIVQKLKHYIVSMTKLQPNVLLLPEKVLKMHMVLQLMNMGLQIMNTKKLLLSKNVFLLMSKRLLKIAIHLVVLLTRSSKSEKADEAVTEVADDEEVDDCLTAADRPAAMGAEASEAVNNSKAAPLIVMNNEEEADLSLSLLCYLFCWNDCLVHSGKNLSLYRSLFLCFNVSVFYLFTLLFVYILLLQIIIIITTYLS